MINILYCRCGQTQLEVKGPPILSVECACASCRRAAETLTELPDGVDPRGPHGTTPFVLYRKDRTRCLAGAETLAEHRLAPDASTRRVVATCCKTPVFLEFTGGHWLSMYAGLWPTDRRPASEMRTMTSDLPLGQTLPEDLPNLRKHSVRFMLKLAAAWVAMGFRVPSVDWVQGGALPARLGSSATGPGSATSRGGS